MKNEITIEQIKAHHYYEQAVKIADLVVIPELSDDSQNYCDAVADYTELTRGLNSISSSRFLSVDMYAFKPDLDELNKNLESLTQIEDNIKQARYLHDLITASIEDGLHEQAIKEQADRAELYQAKQMITRNAYTATRTMLEEFAKTSAQIERAKAKAQAQLKTA